jgi:predicted secreted Zn-dependent protease
MLGCLVLLASADAVRAQVYRCEREGRTAFSDRPCEQGAKASQKAYAAASGASSVLDLQIAVTHYDVEGRDRASLARSMKAHGPKGFHGFANWNVGYDYTTRPNRDGCEFATVRLKVSGEVLMPRWTGAASASPAMQQHWNEFYAALKRHEDGHIQHGRELALLVNERLMGMGVVPCDRVRELSQHEFQRLYDNLKSRDRDYDARTNHGRNQGWP